MKFFLSAVFCLFFSQVALAQETVTVTTYYPSPQGNYRFVRLYPGAAPATCDANNEGTLYYSSTTHRLFVCQLLFGGTWGWGAMVWANAPGNTLDVYYALSGNVGVGSYPTSAASPANGAVTGNLDVNDAWLRSTNSWASQPRYLTGMHCGVYTGGNAALLSVSIPCPNCASDPRTCCPAGFLRVGGDFDSTDTRRFYTCYKL